MPTKLSTTRLVRRTKKPVHVSNDTSSDESEKTTYSNSSTTSKSTSSTKSNWSQVKSSPILNTKDLSEAEKTRRVLATIKLNHPDKLSPRDVERLRATSKSMHKTVPVPEYPTGYKVVASVQKFLKTVETQNNTTIVQNTRKMIKNVGHTTVANIFVKHPGLFDMNKAKHRLVVGVSIETLRETEKDTIDKYLDYLCVKGTNEKADEKYYLNRIGITSYYRGGKKYYRILSGWMTDGL